MSTPADKEAKLAELKKKKLEELRAKKAAAAGGGTAPAPATAAPATPAAAAPAPKPAAKPAPANETPEEKKKRILEEEKKQMLEEKKRKVAEAAGSTGAPDSAAGASSVAASSSPAPNTSAAAATPAPATPAPAATPAAKLAPKTAEEKRAQQIEEIKRKKLEEARERRQKEEADAAASDSAPDGAGGASGDGPAAEASPAEHDIEIQKSLAYASLPEQIRAGSSIYHKVLGLRTHPCYMLDGCDASRESSKRFTWAAYVELAKGDPAAAGRPYYKNLHNGAPVNNLPEIATEDFTGWTPPAPVSGTARPPTASVIPDYRSIAKTMTAQTGWNVTTQQVVIDIIKQFLQPFYENSKEITREEYMNISGIVALTYCSNHPALDEAGHEMLRQHTCILLNYVINAQSLRGQGEDHHKRRR